MEQRQDVKPGRKGDILLHPWTSLLWLVFRLLPVGYGFGGGIQFYEERAPGGLFVALRDQSLTTIGDLLFVPERGTVFTAGLAGVLEFHDDGRSERLSVNSVSALDRDPRNGTELGLSSCPHSASIPASPVFSPTPQNAI